MASTKKFCEVCGTETLHKRGRCVSCDDDLRDEHIRWMRTKRKALMIVTAVFCLVLINWTLAQRYSGDDVLRTVLSGAATSIGIWFSTSKRKEDEMDIGE